MSTWRISGPHLTDEDRQKSTSPGGLTGQPVDTSKIQFGGNDKSLLNPNFPIFAALQRLPHVYQGPVPEYVTADGRTITVGRRLTEAKIAHRRARNKIARASRRVNRGTR